MPTYPNGTLGWFCGDKYRPAEGYLVVNGNDLKVVFSRVARKSYYPNIASDMFSRSVPWVIVSPEEWVE